MLRPLVLLTVVLLSSCSLVPNATIRVALPPGNAEAAEAWVRVQAALPPSPNAVPIEVVAPDAFPPADLVWFGGNLDDPAYLAQALGPNGQVEALGQEAGLAPGWLAPSGDRILPLAWAPWGWWKAGGTVPAATEDDRRILAWTEARARGPELGGEAAAATVQADRDGQVWRSAPTARAAGLPLTGSEGPGPTPSRVLGLWWNDKGWNRDRVPGLLARLWSGEVQALWAANPAWLPVAGPGSGPKPSTIFLVP